MNLITEYQKRHKTCCIPVCHEGVCFFEREGHAAVVVLTSLACRSFTTCVLCDDKKPSVIVEFFVPGHAGAFVPAGHHHVDPCTDLVKFMESVNLSGFTPYYAPSPRDLETWLWRFCTQNSRFRGLKSVETDQQLKLVEQMVHSVQKHPKLYQAYYIAHEAFLPQRKYLLFGEAK